LQQAPGRKKSKGLFQFTAAIFRDVLESAALSYNGRLEKVVSLNRATSWNLGAGSEGIIVTNPLRVRLGEQQALAEFYQARRLLKKQFSGWRSYLPQRRHATAQAHPPRRNPSARRSTTAPLECRLFEYRW